ncbi:hypothetical protein B5S31_g1075 [[Candida] boidinii]|nr:hypothetical protein B5S31_g1075 [[Candida] boidinii]
MYRLTGKATPGFASLLRRRVRLYSSLQNDLDKANTRTLNLSIPYLKDARSEEEEEEKLEEASNLTKSDYFNSNPTLESEPEISLQSTPINEIEQQHILQAIDAKINKFLIFESKSDSLIKKNQKGSKETGEIETLSEEDEFEKLHKYDNLASLLTGDNNATTLPYKSFDKNLQTPFQFLEYLKVRDGEQKIKPRLSVTKVLPGAYCEFRTLFNLYNDSTDAKTSSMIRGTEIHELLERKLHKVEKFHIHYDQQNGAVSDVLAQVDSSEWDQPIEKSDELMAKDVQQEENDIKSEDENDSQLLNEISTQRMSGFNAQRKLYINSSSSSFTDSAIGLETFNKNKLKVNDKEPKLKIKGTSLVKRGRINLNKGSKIYQKVLKPTNNIIIIKFRDNLKNQTMITKIKFKKRGRINLIKLKSLIKNERTKRLNKMMLDILNLLDSRSKFDDTETKLSLEWSRNVLRLTQLIQYGGSREILVHGMYDTQKHHLLTKNTRNYKGLLQADTNRVVLISGIIDHLAFESKHSDAVLQYRKELRDYMDEKANRAKLDIKNKNNNNNNNSDPFNSLNYLRDLNCIIPAVETKAKEWCDPSDPMIFLSVKDVKTRQSKYLPHPYLRQLAQIQVNMYRRFLGILSGETDDEINGIKGNNPVEFTYNMLLTNLRKRGIDPDQTIPSSVVFTLLLNNSYLLEDFKRLCNGEPIGFSPFDNDEIYKIQEKNSFEILKFLKRKDNDPENFSNYILDRVDSSLFKTWNKPVNFKYIAARLAQLYNSLSSFLSNENSIEYVTKQGIFHTLNYSYSKDTTDVCLKAGVSLWLNQRPPEPPMFQFLCKSCQFRYQCEWNIEKQTEQ